MMRSERFLIIEDEDNTSSLSTKLAFLDNHEKCLPVPNIEHSVRNFCTGRLEDNQACLFSCETDNQEAQVINRSLACQCEKRNTDSGLINLGCHYTFVNGKCSISKKEELLEKATQLKEKIANTLFQDEKIKKSIGIIQIMFSKNLLKMTNRERKEYMQKYVLEMYSNLVITDVVHVANSSLTRKRRQSGNLLSDNEVFLVKYTMTENIRSEKDEDCTAATTIFKDSVDVIDQTNQISCTTEIVKKSEDKIQEILNDVIIFVSATMSFNMESVEESKHNLKNYYGKLEETKVDLLSSFATQFTDHAEKLEALKTSEQIGSDDRIKARIEYELYKKQQKDEVGQLKEELQTLIKTAQKENSLSNSELIPIIDARLREEKRSRKKKLLMMKLLQNMEDARDFSSSQNQSSMWFAINK